MATVADFLATSRAAGLTYADMLVVVQYAMINGISADGRMVTAVNSRGTAITMAADVARALIVTLEDLIVRKAGMVVSPGEMVSG